MHALYIDNANIVELSGLSNGMTDTPVGAAAVSVTLTDAAGDELPGTVWPVTMYAVDGSPGTFRGVIPATVGLALNDTVTMHVDAAADGMTGAWRAQVRTAYRG